MFNLEQSITEWRKQMLAVGIKAPVPLDELESHLREEIERKLKPGLSKAAAFEAAVQAIGLGQALRHEFKKVEKDVKWKWTALLPLGWFAAGYILFRSVYYLDYFDVFPFNPVAAGTYFHYTPTPVMERLIAILVILMAEIVFWFLARAGRSGTGRFFPALVCFCLAGMPLLICCTNRPLSFPPVIRQMLALSRPWQSWFDWGQAVLLCLPAIFLIWWIRQKNGSAKQDEKSLCSS